MYVGPSTIGERIRELRHEQSPRLTQRQLAERAGVSVDLISKLEQGHRQTALIGSLHAIASALDVELAALVSKPPQLRMPDDDQESGIVAVRRALTAIDELPGIPAEHEAVSLADLRQSAAHAWEAYWSASYPVLSALLPALIAQARATARQAADHDRDEAYALLSEVYVVAGSLMTLLGYVDLGYLGIDRAIVAAERGDDPLRMAALSATLSWVLLHQGRWDDARQVAVREAERIEPRFGKAAANHVAVWGTLLLTAATSAARGGKAEDADDLISLAQAAATRVGEDRVDYRSTFGPSQVVMQSVDVAVVTDRPGVALDRANRMPVEERLPVAARVRHRADLAFALSSLRKDAEAVDILLGLERMAPDWIRHQAYPRMIVRELVERQRRMSTPRLRRLAIRLGVEPAT